MTTTTEAPKDLQVPTWTPNQFMEVRTYVAMVTPGVAKQILERPDNFNRPRSRTRVAALADIIRRGDWQMNGEPIIFAHNGRLLDGQHRLAAIVEADIAVPAVIIENVDEGAFATIDTGWGRTASHAVHIQSLGTMKESTNVAAAARLALDVRSAVKGGLRQLKRGVGAKEPPTTRQDIIRFVTAHPELEHFATLAHQIYDVSGRLLMVSSMAWLLLELSERGLEQEGEQFLREVASGGYSPHTPAQLLREAMLRLKAGNVRGSHAQGKYTLSAAFLTKAWNMEYLGQTGDRLIYGSRETFPEILPRLGGDLASDQN